MHGIVSHPDPEVARQIRIGAVTVCVDPLNTFIVNRSVAIETSYLFYVYGPKNAD